ncbi:precorrin-2 dehydrogenase/sirohydrochlorin ferrochelatase family protein [Bacillus ndiopicus]|uniref:precorrin-2 dehydrogenase/sirohydrochlorin ferrochelatase family protein n=1 Tax=Bacillus ndiopicus TaxID=1347368 RepID=UPI0005AB4ADC|nr:bifunctional precorrin-2 dehydrogenase/sirohydrochlorin ferrochelatase [Bacillus ndiopicus]
MAYFPALLNIDDKKVVVVGGGKVATQKVRALLPTKALIHIISPQLTEELLAYVQERRVIWHDKIFEAQDLDGALLIFAATDSEKVNDAVEEATQQWQQLSRADAKGRVDFINPAVIRRGDLLLAVSTSGASPGYTKKLKAELEEQFDDSYAQYIEFLKHCRKQILSNIEDASAKRYALKETLRSEVLEWLIAGDIARCEAFLQSLLNDKKG